jgi:hypothetical protein
MPWMTCDGVYQSVRCWEFSALCTTPCQSLIWPHVHHGTRPIASSIAAAAATIAATAQIHHRRTNW